MCEMARRSSGPSETVLGVVFEEVTVTEVDATLDGPRGLDELVGGGAGCRVAARGDVCWKNGHQSLLGFGNALLLFISAGWAHWIHFIARPAHSLSREVK